MVNTNTMTFAKRNGAAEMKIVPIRSPDTTEQTLRQFPTGGVHAPTANPVPTLRQIKPQKFHFGRLQVKKLVLVKEWLG